MSLDYRLSIASGLDAQQVLNPALSELRLTPEKGSTEEGYFKQTQGPGFLASAAPTPPLERIILKEGLDIEPTVNVYFSIDKFSDVPHAVTSMIQAVLAVLRQVPGDAVFLFMGETVLLLRKAGQLYLDKRTGIWGLDRLNLVNLPYTLKDLPLL